MFNFAVLSGNIVNNIIIANSLKDAESATLSRCIQYTEENPAQTGWTYDEESNTFIPPVLDNIE
jgi:hypothetical protein